MNAFSYQSKMMGSAFKLMLLHENEKKAKALLEIAVNEIQRIENLLSEFLSTSETSRMNQMADETPVRISSESYALIDRCLAISKLTKGCFDISVGPLKKIYQFKNQAFVMPSTDCIQNTLQKVGYQKIILNPHDQTIQFTCPNLQISFAAIGKGYASDCVKKIWKAAGVKSGFINASGDLNVFGNKADGTAWNIGIANPNDPSKMLFSVPISNASVATSGDYEQHFIHQGKRYSHNINPITGLPATGIKSVTVFSPSAELSDALATAAYIKGPEEGIQFIEELPDTHCVIIDEENQLYLSKQLQYEAASA